MSKDRKMTDTEVRQRKTNTCITGEEKQRNGTEQRFKDIIKKILEDFPGGPLRCHTSTAGGMGPIPGQGSSACSALRPPPKKERKHWRNRR